MVTFRKGTWDGGWEHPGNSITAITNNPKTLYRTVGICEGLAGF